MIQNNCSALHYKNICNTTKIFFFFFNQVPNFFQKLSNPDYASLKHFQFTVALFTSVFGTSLSLVEVLSYVNLFHYIWKHDNTLANAVLDSKSIGSRNRSNAIGLAGLFATWLLEILYILMVGFLHLFIEDSNFLREVVASIKYFDFFLIPFVQVNTSPPIKRFIESRKEM